MRVVVWLITVLSVAGIAAGCSSKNQSAKVTAEKLQKSFEKAEPLVAQEVVQAGSAFQAGNYSQAVLIMDRVAQTQRMDDTQKKAVDDLIIQTRQAVQRNPKLDSPQLYQAVSDLFTKVHPEN